MYERILIVVDEGAVARAALSEGLELARVHAAEVLLFHVLQNYAVPLNELPGVVDIGPMRFRKLIETKALKLLSSATDLASARGVHATHAMGSGLDAADCIALAAEQHDCRLIVIGSFGRTAAQRLMAGSTVTRLITLSTVPLLVCKAPRAAVRKSRRVAPPGRRAGAHAGSAHREGARVGQSSAAS